MKSRADIVIIGGGIQGISLAYHLTQHGIRDICLVEMNTLGSGSSGRSAAIIGHAFQTEECLPLTRWSYGALMRFEEEFGVGPGYEAIGCLVIASPQYASDLNQRHALLQHLDIESHILDHAQILELTPGLNLEDIEVGLYCPHEGNIDPHTIMMAYGQQARRHGVEFVEGVRATGLQIASSQVVGVHTTGGTIATPCVVNAAGFCGGQVGAWSGLDLPITNLKRHIFFTEPVPIYGHMIPFTYEQEVAWYMRREGPGMLIGMGAVECDDEDPQVDWSFVDVIGTHSMHRAPALAEAGIQNGWAGLRPVTPDDGPILGPVPHLGGYFNDCGWGGHGVMHAPAAGKALAEWIVEGIPTSVDIRCFAAGRFG